MKDTDTLRAFELCDADLQDARARIAKLERALKPFAEAPIASEEYFCGDEIDPKTHLVTPGVYVDDFQRAAAALKGKNDA